MTSRDAVVAEETLRAAIRDRIALGGAAWGLASWALMLGDVEGARAHLRRGAEEASREWRASMPKQGALRFFSRDQALPNQNRVREHFALALVLGDDAALRETSGYLRAWLQTTEDMLRKQGAKVGVGPLRYSHSHGYLDLICELLPGGKRPDREQALNAGGGPSSMRICCVALVEGDAAMLSRGLDGMLAEHAKTLERKTSPPAAVSAPAVEVAAAARRLGIGPIEVDEKYRAHRVPYDIRNPDRTVQRGRLPVDLLGRALWER